MTTYDVAGVGELVNVEPRRADGATLLAIYALVILIVPANQILRSIPISVTPADVLSLVLALCWMCATLTNSLGMAKGRSAVRTALFLYATSMLITYGHAAAGYLPPDELKLSDHALVLVIAHVGLALAVCDGVRTIDRLNLVLKAVVVGGTVCAAIGALQFLFNYDLTVYLHFPGLKVNGDVQPVDVRNSLRRVWSTTGHPIEFGVLCGMLLPIAVHFGFRARKLHEGSLRWWACALILCMGLLFSISRSAIVSVGSVLIVLMLGWPMRRKIQALIGGIFVMALTTTVVPGLLGTLFGLFANAGNDPSVQYRQHRYDIASAEIAKHLWFGRGIGTWYAPKYIAFDNQWIYGTLESGYVGIFTYGLIFLVGIYAAVRSMYHVEDEPTRDLGLTLAACLVVPLVTSATFDFASFGTVTGISFLLIGAAGALLRIGYATDADRPKDRAGERRVFRRLSSYRAAAERST